MSKFQPGDLVRIKDGVHEEGMGDKRVALIISEWTPRGADANPKMKYTSIYNIKIKRCNSKLFNRILFKK